MIDYGVVAIKNGKVINEGMSFMNMLEAVGWVDRKRIRHPDCDCFDDPDPLLAKSNCYYCRRAQRQRVEFVDADEFDTRLVADCKGQPFESNTSCIDGNYFAYVGDKHLTLAFYKQHCIILVDKLVYFQMWGIDNFQSCKKSIHFKVANVQFHLKELDNWVYHISFHYNGDNYHVIYGYGIDSNRKIWNKYKVRYLGKKTSRKVDNLYARLITKLITK